MNARTANEATARTDLRAAGYGGHAESHGVVITRGGGYHSTHASWSAARDALLNLDPPGYAARVAELESEGMTTSDAQAVADAEFHA